MNKYLYGAVIVAFLAILGYAGAERLRADRLAGEVGRLKAQQIDAKQTARELELSKAKIEDLVRIANKASRSPKAESEKTDESVAKKDSPEAVALSKGQPMPFDGAGVKQSFLAKSLACLEYSDQKTKALGESMGREEKLELKLDRARGARKFWQYGCLAALGYIAITEVAKR